MNRRSQLFVLRRFGRRFGHMLKYLGSYLIQLGDQAFFHLAEGGPEIVSGGPFVHTGILYHLPSDTVPFSS
jgi:hypothetical protein